MHPRWVGYQLGKILEPEAIVLDDAISNSDYVCAHHERSQAGTYFASGGSSGGWGAGAAFGAKLAAPDRDVVLATGDGYFMFGTPMPALWSAEHYKAPFLTVVFVNRSYTTGTNGLQAYLSQRRRGAHGKLRRRQFSIRRRILPSSQKPAIVWADRARAGRSRSRAQARAGASAQRHAGGGRGVLADAGGGDEFCAAE